MVAESMRVLHVEAGRHLYGGALQVLYLVRGLQHQGVDNLLLCPPDSEMAVEARRLGLPVQALPMGGDTDPLLAWRLRQCIKQSRPDLVHVHSRRGADVWGGLAARWAGCPAVVTRRVDNPESPWVVALKYRLYRHVITISEGIRGVLLGEGLAPERVTNVPSAVDMDLYRPGCERPYLEQALGETPPGPAIAMVAQFIERKGHRDLLQVLPDVIDQVPRLRVYLFGRGPLLASMQHLAHKMRLDDHVRFAGFRDDLHRLLPCFQLLVHPAYKEGLGVSLLQAAACGLPLVAGDCGGIPEIVRHWETGLLVPPGDRHALQEALVALLRDPARAAAMGIRARQWVEQRFSIDAMVKGNLAVYRRVLDDAR